MNESIVFFAFRYALGRKTYAVSTVVGFLQENWENLSYKCKSTIQREIKQAIKSGNAGDTMDVEAWEQIRSYNANLRV